jgi:hypothetical protein
VYRAVIALSTRELSSHHGKVGRIEFGMAARADVVVDSRPLIFLVVNELKQFFDLKGG